ncbi:MAG: xghA [Chloroflexi bacterium]|nr:xghA [Chloroflexota bacterium]
MDTVVYLATDEGVVTLRRKSDGSLEEVGRGPKGWAVQGIAVDPATPNRILAGTRGDGVWVSEDFGTSWTKPCYGKRGPGKVRCVTIDPHNPNRVYAGGEPIDVFVSEDMCKTWQRMDSPWEVPFVSTVTYPGTGVEPHVRDITVSPTDPDTIYIALQVGYMLKTTDGGETWKLLNENLDCDVHTIVIDPKNSDKVMVATGGGDSRKHLTSGRALYLSQDGGSSWNGTAMQIEQEYSVPLAMHPTNPDVLFSAVAHGNPNMWRGEAGADSHMIRTRDGGATWQAVDRGRENMSRRYPEGIAFDEGHPDRMFTGYRTGEIFVSEDAGDSWSLSSASVTHIADMRAVPA